MKTRWKIVLILSLIGNCLIVYVAIKALEYRSHINEFLDKYTYVVREFSGRNFYEQDNFDLKADEIGVNRIVFFGTQTVQTWPFDNQFAEYEVINRGITGQRFAGMVLRFIPDVIDLHPEYVVIEISSYNFRPEYSVEELKDYMLTIIITAQAYDVKPIIGTVIPPCRDSVDLGEYKIMDSVATYNQWLRENAVGLEYSVSDWNNILADANGFLEMKYASGAIDLNAEGYHLISQDLNELIDQLKSR